LDVREKRQAGPTLLQNEPGAWSAELLVEHVVSDCSDCSPSNVASMKKLAVGFYMAVALLGLFGVIVLYNAPLDARQLVDGYGVSDVRMAGKGASETASLQIAR
jgi:hypothetical protein